LYARLNWQLACQFSSANHLSYRIVSFNGWDFLWSTYVWRHLWQPVTVCLTLNDTPLLTHQAESLFVGRVTDGNDGIQHRAEMKLRDTEISGSRFQPIREPRGRLG